MQSSISPEPRQEQGYLLLINSHEWFYKFFDRSQMLPASVKEIYKRLNPLTATGNER